MGLVSRDAGLAVALAAGAVTAGCGGSVADADATGQTRATPPPASPFCVAARANSDAIRPLNGLVARGAAPPEELSSTVDAVRRTGADLLSTAPAEIRPDVERTVGAVNLQLDALVASGGDAAAAARDPALATQLNSPDIAEASRRFTTYVTTNCPR